MDDFQSIKIEIPENFQINLIEPQDDDFEQQFELIQDDISGLASIIDIKENGIKIKGIEESKSSQKSREEEIKDMKCSGDYKDVATSKRKRRAMSSKYLEDLAANNPEIPVKSTKSSKKSATKTVKITNLELKSDQKDKSLKIDPANPKTSINQPQTPNTSSSSDNITDPTDDQPKKTKRVRRSAHNELDKLKIHGRTSDYFASFDQLPMERESRRKGMSTSKLLTDIINHNEEFESHDGPRARRSDKFVRKSQNFDDIFANNLTNFRGTDEVLDKNWTDYCEYLTKLDDLMEKSKNCENSSSLLQIKRKLLLNPANFIKKFSNFIKKFSNFDNKLKVDGKSTKIADKSFKESENCPKNQQNFINSIPKPPKVPQTTPTKPTIKLESFGSSEKLTINIDPIASEEPKVFTCNRCQLTFSTYLSIRNHNSRTHKKNKTNLSQVKKHSKKCQFCGSTLNYYGLKCHKLTMQKFGFCEKKVCPICQKSSWKGIDEHMKEQHPNEMTFCKICNLKFRNWKSCKRHMRNLHVVVPVEEGEKLKKKRNKFVKSSLDQSQDQSYFHDFIVKHLNVD